MSDACELYRRWLAELWGGEPGAAERLATEDFVGHWPDGEVRGQAALAARVAMVRSVVPDLALDVVVGPLSEGELVAARWAARSGVAGPRLAFLGNDLLRVRDGRVVEYWPAGAIQPVRVPLADAPARQVATDLFAA